MSKEQKILIRQAILAAAKKAGIENANQFGNLAVRIGAVSKRQAIYYYTGQRDISTAKASVFFEHFHIDLP